MKRLSALNTSSMTVPDFDLPQLPCLVTRGPWWRPVSEWLEAGLETLWD